MPFYIPTLFKEQLGTARRVSVFRERVQYLPNDDIDVIVALSGGRGDRFKYSVSCCVRLPDGNVVREEAAIISPRQDLSIPSGPHDAAILRDLRSSLKDEIRGKYPAAA